MPTDILSAHKGIVKQCKVQAINRNATDIDRGITEHFSKPKEILSDNDLVDPFIDVIHKEGTISITTNERVCHDKYHHSNVFTLYHRSSIRKLLDNLTTSLIQNLEDNMASLEGASNHRLEFINKIYVKFHEIDPPSARSYIPTPKKLANSKAIINPENDDANVFYMQLVYLFFMMRLIRKIQVQYMKNY